LFKGPEVFPAGKKRYSREEEESGKEEGEEESDEEESDQEESNEEEKEKVEHAAERLEAGSSSNELLLASRFLFAFRPLSACHRDRTAKYHRLSKPHRDFIHRENLLKGELSGGFLRPSPPKTLLS